MCLQVGLVRELITLITGALLDEVEDASHVTIKVGLCEFTALHTSHNRIELLGLTRLEHIVTSPHLNSTVLTTEPVGHHGSLVAPLIAEDGLHEVMALRGIDTVHIVIRGHHRPRLALLDGNLETFQVDLTQGTLRDMSISVHTVGLLIVGCEVLDARAYVVLLNASDIG